MRRLLTIALLFIAQFSFAQKDPAAKTILDAMKTKYESFSAFKVTVKQDMLDSKNKVMNSYELKATVKKEKYKLEVAGQVIYNNGRTVWKHLVEDEEVYISDPNSSEDDEEDVFQSPSKLYNLHKDGFKYAKVGTETISGTSCDVVELAPIDQKKFKFFKIRLYVSKSDKTLKQWVVFEKDPDTLQVVKYKFMVKSFTPNLKVTEQTFTFDPAKHPDVEVIDMRD